MTNVLFVSHSSELNGAERMLLDTIRGLDRRKFSPLLAVPRPGPLAEAAAGAGVECLALPMKWTLTEANKVWKQPFSCVWNTRGKRAAARLIRSRGIGLVVTNTAAVWTGAKAARQTGVPHVWFVHEILDGERPLLKYVFGRKALVRRMTRLSDRIVANSDASARAFAGSGKTVVVGNGIAARNGPAPDSSAFRDSLGIEPGASVAGIIGKIYPGKGQMEAVLAADILRRARPGLRLLVVGAVDDARYHGRIREAVGRLGLERNVLFLGYRDDLEGILGLLDVLVVASSVDSLGRIALEAMAAGTPVIAAAKGGLPEVVRDGETGLLVASPEPGLFAAGIARLLDDPALARRLGEGGRKFVAANYSLEGQVRKIERVLEECLEG
jgi:glycosyltransferase involved in cell wall biosynthesis